jgi:hypothetical protein
MFKSIVPQTIINSFLAAKWRAEKDRQEEADNRLCIYSDDYEEIIRDTLKTLFCKENYENLYYHVNQSQNIFKRVVNQISMIYKADAQRVLDIESDRYEAIKEEVDINTRMRKVNRLTNALNDIIVMVAVHDGRICYDLITPNVCTVIQDPDNPSKMDALIYRLTSVNTPTSANIRYAYWDVNGNHAILDGYFRTISVIYSPDGSGGGMPYPYRDKSGAFVIPAVVLHRQHPEDSFWDQDSGRDLYNAAVGLGWKLTLKDYYFKSASFKQIYVIADDLNVPNKQRTDVSTMLHLRGEDSEIGTLDLQVAIDKLVESITADVNMIINNYGISADMWTLSVSEMSGRALKIRNMALLEQRQEQTPTYRRFETELFEKTRIVNNAHAGFFGWEQIPENAVFTVDFGEIEFPEDPVYEIDLEAKRLKSGIIGLGQFYQRFNPDITDIEEAEKAILENLNKLKTTREANPSLDEALDFIMSAKKKPGEAAGAQGQGQGEGAP